MFIYRTMKNIWRIMPETVKKLIRNIGCLNRTKLRTCNYFTKRVEHNDIYDKDYYLKYDEMCMRSAEIMAESIVAEFAPSTVIDVGCGSGALLYCLDSHSVNAEGLEYSDAAINMCRLRGLDVIKFDLENDVISSNLKRYNLVASTEVAEHLPESCSERFVDLLCSMGDKVLFTAATPGPTGTDHVNEQPHEYWIDKFKARGFRYDKVLTAKLRSTWKEKGVTWWYHSNLMIFFKA